MVELVTNRLERLAPGVELRLRPPTASLPGPRSRAGGAGRPPGETGGAGMPDHLVVATSRPHGRRHLVRFAGVADLEAAEALRGAVLLAEPIEDAGALFVHELIGSRVVDAAGRVRGTVTAVEANPASDLLVIDDRQLVPLVFVVATEPGRVVVDPPEGLLE